MVMTRSLVILVACALATFAFNGADADSLGEAKTLVTGALDAAPSHHKTAQLGEFDDLRQDDPDPTEAPAPAPATVETVASGAGGPAGDSATDVAGGSRRR